VATCWVISGTSRGLGSALCRLARARGDRVLGIDRSAQHGGADVALRHDLSRLEGLAEALLPLLHGEIRPEVDRYVLVNNAAVLEPIGDRADAAAIATHLSVNLGAVVLLSRLFIDALAEVPAAKLIVNISSGAAQRAIRGWSLYCASKAAVEHFARCLALEQADAALPCDAVSISPGVIDTGMQARIRASSEQDFPDLAHFAALHAGGHLAQAGDVAAKLLRGVDRADRHHGATLGIDRFAAGVDAEG